mmetsp:Transcript_105682/g.146132  ORF Transcript_105682/g.146132 Transcript_105682/m.146132 type:complete len:87 (+) Transcript_105682:1035-1295(+)
MNNPQQKKPTSKEFISKLVDKKFGALGPVMPEPNKECLICLDTFDSDAQVYRLPCGHVFHTKCILLWLEVQNTCPACRKEFPTEPV